jgi:hypothetical protein
MMCAAEETRMVKTGEHGHDRERDGDPSSEASAPAGHDGAGREASSDRPLDDREVDESVDMLGGETDVTAG